MGCTSAENETQEVRYLHYEATETSIGSGPFEVCDIGESSNTTAIVTVQVRSNAIDGSISCPEFAYRQDFNRLDVIVDEVLRGNDAIEGQQVEVNGFFPSRSKFYGGATGDTFLVELREFNEEWFEIEAVEVTVVSEQEVTAANQPEEVNLPSDTDSLRTQLSNCPARFTPAEWDDYFKVECSGNN